MTAALALHEITKRFASVRALDGAGLRVRPGTVHALLGENGAGKTTLMRVAFGMIRPDSGVVRIDGRAAGFRSPADAMAAGVGMVHQHFALVPTMTVAENVALGGRGRYDARGAAAAVERIGSATGLVLDPAALAGELPVSGQQRLEIVKALARDARILILDEPTAVLAPGEAGELLSRLRAFADGGRAVVLITHKLREALSIADDVTVLRHGATVLSAPSSEVSEAGLVAAMLGAAPGGRTLSAADAGVIMGTSAAGWLEEGRAPVAAERVQRGLGRDAEAVTTKAVVDDGKSRAATAPSASAPIILEAHGLAVSDRRGVMRVRDVSLAIRGGEIVGIAAIEGAGHHELLRALAGRLAPAGGTLRRPAAVGFIPEDRQGDALILDFSLTENVALRGAGSAAGRVDWQATESRTGALLDGLDIRAEHPRVAASTLSGGNQQKLVFARELDGAPAALVAENPTRGLDIQATAAVHDRLRAAAASGTAVVVHSSDLDELLALATRMLVMYAGTVREVPHDREEVGRAMLGLAEPIG